MPDVKIIVPEPVEPTVVITMTLKEAVGLNTLLDGATTCSLDELLGIRNLQSELWNAMDRIDESKLGYFTDSVDISDFQSYK